MSRTVLIVVPSVVALLIGFLFFFGQSHQQTDLIAPPAAIQTGQAAVAAEHERAAMLERQLTDARIEAAESEQKARALAAKLATNRMKSAGGSPVNPLKDPELRQAMEKQQLQALERKIKQLVNAKLIDKLNLSPEQANELRDILRQKQAPAMKLMTALMAGELDEAQIAEMGGRAQQEIKDADAQMKTLLGPEGYSYLDYQEKSEGERHQLRELKSQFADAGHPLRPQQSDSLLAAMYDERHNFKFQIDFHDPTSFDLTRFPDYYTDENLDRFYSEMQQLNSRIVAKAESILDPEQLSEFQRALQEKLERGRATVRMTQSVFPMKKRP
jgi:hypothetical protein